MLRLAPKFYEVAKRIVEITEGCIIVAHNSEFDYRILRTEFSRLGFEFKRKTLCTVELAKKIMPEQASYSLGKLTRALGIPVSNRHRASGDALATVQLFKLLLAKDLKKQIVQEAIKAEPKYQVGIEINTMLEEVPAITGIYYLHDAYGKVIYLGKSRNIRNRVFQHSSNPKVKKIQNQVAAVTYEATGNELIAALKENAELEQNKPSLNKRSRHSVFTHALYSFTDANGYINLKIEPVDNKKSAIATFSNQQSSRHFLFKAIETYKLCPKLMGMDATKTSCFKYHNQACDGACIQKESPESYNLKVEALLAKNTLKNRTLLIVDKGRTVDERSVVLIEDGVFKGYGFISLNYQITNKKVLESIITPMASNQQVLHIIQSYLRKNKRIKIINL